MADQNMQNFVRASSALTGIAQEGLAPQVDPSKVTPGQTPVGVQYYDQANTAAPQALAALLAIVAANPNATPDQLAALILGDSDQSVVFLAKSIMLMWYLGSWYDPNDLQAYQANPSVPPGSLVVSPAAYQAGWVWPVAQTHPMGYSNLRFGYWSSTPPPLDQWVPINPGGQS